MQQISQDRDLLDNNQQQLFDWLNTEMTVYFSLTEEARQLRQSEQANIAQWRLRTQALPLAREAERLLSDIVQDHREATGGNVRRVNLISKLAIGVGVTLIVGVFLCLLMLMLRSRSGSAGVKLAATLGAVLLVGADSLPADEITPADVYRHVVKVAGEVELLRMEMGKPEHRPGMLQINGAAPRDVYFQAITMLRRTDQLCFEQMRQRVPLPDAPEGEITPAATLQIIQLVLGRIAGLKQRLEIPEATELPERQRDKTPDDVFREVVRINSQLNLLLQRRFSPSDTYQQLTLAIGYASNLLSVFPDAQRLPDPPDFERGKQPMDVFSRLMECHQISRKIAEKSGTKTLSIRFGDQVDERVRPGQVYDLTSLLVAELAYLHQLRGDLQPPRRVFQPGSKFPSHAYQRAGLLQRQLENLLQAVENQPDWLTSDAE